MAGKNDEGVKRRKRVKVKRERRKEEGKRGKRNGDG